MMLAPCWPSAGPTGGAGVACPAGHCSLTWAMIGLAMLLLTSRRFSLGPSAARVPCRSLYPDPRGSGEVSFALPPPGLTGLEALHLQEIQLHRGRAPEDRDHDLELLA